MNGFADTFVPQIDGQEAQSPQEYYQQGVYRRMEELNPEPLHHTQAPQQFDISSSFPPALHRMQAFQNSQGAHATEQASPAATVRHSTRGHQTSPNTPLADQASSGGLLQVIGFWGNAMIRMSFDPDGSGEEFYQAFARWAQRRKPDSELERLRDKTVLVVKTSKDSEDDWEIGLAQSELDSFWKTHVDWMQKNKSPTAPHLYATVELEYV